MKTIDIFLSIFIILIYIGFFFVNILVVGSTNIKKNWPKYRCNPIIMPLAGYFGHDPTSNFTYCIQNMQTSYMNYLLKPTHYVMSLFQNTLGQLSNDINWVRKKIESLVSNLTTIITSIFSVFINIMIEFQRMLIKLKDVFSKALGVMVSMIYLIEGGMLTGTSIMAGPVGETLRFVCFHPDTKVMLKDGREKKMKEIELGDILSNNSKVLATMKIRGNKYENYGEINDYYKIYSNEYNNYIYVTGSHLIQDEETNNFIPVRKYKKATKCNNMKTEMMNCLITDDHLIQIGEYTFWDWED